jgi:RNase P subunit RPR2
MRRNAKNIPRDWVYCSKCDVPYGFIKCRVTVSDKTGVRNICLHCRVLETQKAPVYPSASCDGDPKTS